MNLNDPSALFSSLLIGLIGMAIFIYGKKSGNMKCLGIGLALCIGPYFIASLLWQWLLTAAGVLGLFVLPKGS